MMGPKRTPVSPLSGTILPEWHTNTISTAHPCMDRKETNHQKTKNLARNRTQGSRLQSRFPECTKKRVSEDMKYWGAWGGEERGTHRGKARWVSFKLKARERAIVRLFQRQRWGNLWEMGGARVGFPVHVVITLNGTILLIHSDS